MPIQLAQCWFRALAIYNANISKIKYRATEAILSNGTRKLLWFEISKMLTAVFNNKFVVIYYNFRHTFVPYTLPGRHM